MSNVHDHAPNKAMITEAAFKTAYIANFLSTYMAINYDDDCMDGHSQNRGDHQPVEDASYLANVAWEQLQEKL